MCDIFLRPAWNLSPDISCHGTRADPGVSPASPWARATPHPKATNWKKKKKKLYYTLKKKNYTYTLEKKKICIHKIKFLLEGKNKYLEDKNKK
jgi:hypothetical protein